MMTRRRITDEEIYKIPEFHKQGWSIKQIAKQFGISPTTMARIITGKLYSDLHDRFRQEWDEATIWLQEQSKNRVCTICGIQHPATKEFFPIRKRSTGELEARCLKCKHQQHKARLDTLRIEALTHYSKYEYPICECCDEINIEFLTIDHIDGGGSEHRKQIAGKFSTIGQWLKQAKYPIGFRVLCMNCNWSLGVRGYCPHQRIEIKVELS